MHLTWSACHVSHVTCHIFFFFFLRTKWSSLSVEGLLSTGLTPSSFDLIPYSCVGNTNNWVGKIIGSSKAFRQTGTHWKKFINYFFK